VTAERWTLERGATVQQDGAVHFAVWAPHARAVAVVSAAAGGPAVPLAGDGRGAFAATVPGFGPGTDYRLRLDGMHEYPDPVSRWQPAGVHGPSRVVDPRAFSWTDAAWRGREMADLILYELHVGTFTEAGTFAAAAERLPALRSLGVTAVELMPVAEFPGRRNWGYDGVHPYAPASPYGGPEELRRFVDAAHAADLAVVLDVVYNHLGPEGNTLAAFGPYFTDRYRTPWGPALNFDGPGSDEVRRYMIDNACYWITEYHVDGLRLDAIHGIVDQSAIHVVHELTAAVHAQGRALRRTTLVIAESDLNDPRVVREPERGGYGCDAQWSDDFHHAVHAALTGERSGYYADFGGVEPVAKTLRDRFVVDGRYSAFRDRHHGAPATDVPADRFVVAIQTHDQVGNRARGERLSALVPFQTQKLAAALLLLSPYVPLLFMGEEYGETNPFLYFTSHGDPALAEAVREGRRREFAAFEWSGGVPNPQSPDTFAQSRLSWSWADDPQRAALRALYRDLLALRRSEAPLRPGGATIRVTSDVGARWITMELAGSAGTRLSAAFNLSDHPVTASLPAATGRWQPLLSTDAPAYAGRAPEPPDLDGRGATLRLGPWSAMILREEPR
jgi:maltooligosyltrehalose trehalohydrolase